MDPMSRLRDHISRMDSALVCFSGGLDSTLLLSICLEECREARAFTSEIPHGCGYMRSRAAGIADHLGGRIFSAKMDGASAAKVLENGPMRCYECKRAMYASAKGVADSLGIEHVLCGDNADDDPADRPGMRAAEEFGVESPFREFGMTRSMIEEGVRRMGLPFPMGKETCLLMRFPVGRAVTESELRMVESIESSIREATGLETVRARMGVDGIELQTLREDIRILKEKEGALTGIASGFGCRLSISDAPYRG